jgi:hypothetical protein
MRRGLVLIFIALFAAPALAEDAKPRHACRADVERLCAGVKPGGGRIRECFKAHRSEISPACRAALEERRAALQERRSGQTKKQ